MHTRLVLVALCLLSACGTSAPAPDHAPAPHGGAEHGDAKVPAAEPAHAEPAPTAGSKLALSGTIAFEGTTTATAVFVSVKDPANPGPPLAAKKLPPGPFPLSFTLTDADIVSMGGPARPIPATVALSVTLDTDGNAMTKEPGDPKATVETPAEKADLAVTLAATP